MLGLPVSDSGLASVTRIRVLNATHVYAQFAFASCGFLLGPFMLFAFACTSVTALFMLAECADEAGRPATFNTVAEKSMPGSGILIDVAVAIKCFGVATSYLIVIGDSVPKSVIALGGSGLLIERRTWTLVALVFAAPLAYMKKITGQWSQPACHRPATPTAQTNCTRGVLGSHSVAPRLPGRPLVCASHHRDDHRFRFRPRRLV